MFEKDCVRIYYWPSKKTFGHVALSTQGAKTLDAERGTYVSFWPAVVTPGAPFLDFEGDKALRRNFGELEDPEEYDLYSLDIKKIEDAFQAFRKSNYSWHILGSSFFFARNQNCSGLVSYLLIEGGINKYFPFSKNVGRVFVYSLYSGVVFALFRFATGTLNILDIAAKFINRIPKNSNTHYAKSIMGDAIDFALIRENYICLNIFAATLYQLQMGVTSLISHYVSKKYSLSLLSHFNLAIFIDDVFTCCSTFLFPKVILKRLLERKWLAGFRFFPSAVCLTGSSVWLFSLTDKEIFFNLPLLLMKNMPLIFRSRAKSWELRGDLHNVFHNSIMDEIAHNLAAILGLMITPEIPLSPLVFTPNHVKVLVDQAEREEIKIYNRDKPLEMQRLIKRPLEVSGWKQYVKPVGLTVGLAVVGFFAVRTLSESFKEFEQTFSLKNT